MDSAPARSADAGNVLVFTTYPFSLYPSPLERREAEILSKTTACAGLCLAHRVAKR